MPLPRPPAPQSPHPGLSPPGGPALSQTIPGPLSTVRGAPGSMSAPSPAPGWRLSRGGPDGKGVNQHLWSRSGPSLWAPAGLSPAPRASTWVGEHVQSPLLGRQGRELPSSGVPVPVWSLQVAGAPAPVPDWGRWPLAGYLIRSFRYSQPSLEYSRALEGATDRADITVRMPVEREGPAPSATASCPPTPAPWKPELRKALRGTSSSTIGPTWGN